MPFPPDTKDWYFDYEAILNRNVCVYDCASLRWLGAKWFLERPRG